MKKIVILLIFIVSVNTLSEGILKITYRMKTFYTSEIELEKKVDLEDIIIKEEDKVSIETKNFIFYVEKDNLKYYHNKNEHNIRRGVQKLETISKKYNDKTKIDFRETLYDLIKDKKIKIFDKKEKKYLTVIAIANGYGENYSEKYEYGDGYIYERLIYTEDLERKIIVCDWRYHLQISGKNKVKNAEVSTKNESEKIKLKRKLREEAKNNPGKQFVGKF